jgi:hypothetical protein
MVTSFVSVLCEGASYRLCRVGQSLAVGQAQQQLGQDLRDAFRGRLLIAAHEHLGILPRFAGRIDKHFHKLRAGPQGNCLVARPLGAIFRGEPETGV